MVNVVLHISLKKIFHCGVYQYACLIRVIFAVFLSRSRSSFRLGNCWIKHIPWLLALDNHTVLWYTVCMRLNKWLYRAANPVAGFPCHGSSRPGNKCVVITIFLKNTKRLHWYLQFIGSSTIPLKFHINAITKRNSGNSERLWETARKHLDSIGGQRQWATG